MGHKEAIYIYVWDDSFVAVRLKMRGKKGFSLSVVFQSWDAGITIIYIQL